jgi:hypothetical protein
LFANPTVVALGLGNNLLTGPIPSELGALDQLTSLLLHNNSLTGLLPNELGDLSSLTVLQLDTNQLQGPLPVDLGRITTLKELSLEGNDLSGNVPSDVCLLGESLLTVTVDCDRVQCTCCEPCNVTSVTTTVSPTMEATGQASTPPSSTIAPTDECHEIEALSSCFVIGQAIELTLFQCNRRGDEILALFRVKDVDRNTLRNPLIWESTCQESRCHGVIAEGSLSFDDSTSMVLDGTPWPLPDEEYVLMLLEFLGEEGSFRVSAESEPFKVTNMCV